MPELPEVETIRGQLKREVLNEKIEKVIIKDKRLIKEITPASFKSKVEGKFIKDILRRGKVLVIKLEEKSFLIIHLRISGWLLLSKEPEKQGRVIFKLAEQKLLNFCDSRVLSEIKLVDEWQKLPIIKQMGPEPLELKKNEFIKLFEGRKTEIKPLLMDQKFLAGVGNIYAQEALFCAGVHPERRADSLRKEQLEKIYTSLLSILTDAIVKGGSSVDTYRQIDGKEGEYIPFLKVYQRQSKPCLKCKTVIKRETIAGRGTYFCPHCQR